MQILLAFIVVLIIVTLIIYKINDKFEKKELLMLIGIYALLIGGFLLYLQNQDKKLPNLFKNKYEKEKNISIDKLSYELLNNKTLTSKNYFEYKFIYTIIKDDKRYLCTIDKVSITKVGNEFILTPFKELIEKCQEQ